MRTFVLLTLFAAVSACTTEMLSPSGARIPPPTVAKKPPQVDPIVINGKQYGGGFIQGVLPITDVTTGQKIKNVTIYNYAEPVFIKSLKLVNGNQDILIENERGEKFLFNIKSETVKPLPK